jgi:ATP-dependent Lon protease
VVVIAVPWNEFAKIPMKLLKKKAVILDCWRLLDKVKDSRIEYLGVG